MKEIYAWVPWFRELAEKIAEGGEAYLIEKAKQVAWKEDEEDGKCHLLNYGDHNIDPFSFFYTLAGYCKYPDRRKKVLDSISEQFEMPEISGIAPDKYRTYLKTV